MVGRVGGFDGKDDPAKECDNEEKEQPTWAGGGKNKTKLNACAGALGLA